MGPKQWFGCTVLLLPVQSGKICNKFFTQRVKMVQFIRKHELLETVKDRTVITETSLASLNGGTGWPWC